MIAYTIKAALDSGCFQKVVVTTEDREIAKVAKKYGAQVINRPQELANDTAKTADVILHAIDYLEKEKKAPKVVALLQPNSPLCLPEDIKGAVELFFGQKCDSVVSMYEPTVSPYWMFKTRKKYVQPFFGCQYFSSRSQDLPKAYMPNGAIYVISTKRFKRDKKFYFPKTLPYIMPADRSIDIDTELDFRLTEFILKQHRRNEKKSKKKQ